jgi:deazaflavin-dependent oxidoreductase (nitroreductase family)
MSGKQKQGLPAGLAGEEYCYLTTTGRVSGRPHEIEIWFGLRGHTLYLLSGGGERSDWVKNLRAQPAVRVRIAQHNFAAMARIVSEAEEDRLARELLADKYQEREEDQSLSEWARTALPVALELE